METVLRVGIIYVVIVMGLRILGKREFAQLSPVELVLLLLIPEIVSQSLLRERFFSDQRTYRPLCPGLPYFTCQLPQPQIFVPGRGDAIGAH